MATTRTFPEWLAEQTDRGDEIAAFAEQVQHLTDFPESGGRSIYEGYFETALPQQQEEFSRAWDEFAASPEPARSDGTETPSSLS